MTWSFQSTSNGGKGRKAVAHFKWNFCAYFHPLSGQRLKFFTWTLAFMKHWHWTPTDYSLKPSPTLILTLRSQQHNSAQDNSIFYWGWTLDYNEKFQRKWSQIERDCLTWLLSCYSGLPSELYDLWPRILVSKFEFYV